MRFMMIIKATRDSETGKPPSPQLLEAMSAYNEQLTKAGVLVAAEGLHPSTNGTRLSYPDPGGEARLAEGPFSVSKEGIAGFTLIDVRSKEEAVEWALRMPDPHGLGEGEIELRQMRQTLNFI